MKIRQPGYAPFVRTERRTLDLTPEQEAKFWDFAYAQIGKPYDWRAIVAFAADRDWRDDGAWFCSEYFIRAVEVSGWFEYPVPSIVSRVTPSDALLLIGTRTPFVLG